MESCYTVSSQCKGDVEVYAEFRVIRDLFISAERLADWLAICVTTTSYSFISS